MSEDQKDISQPDDQVLNKVKEKKDEVPVHKRNTQGKYFWLLAQIKVLKEEVLEDKLYKVSNHIDKILNELNGDEEE